MGAEEISSFGFSVMAIGGLIGSITGAFMTQNFEPRYCFITQAIVSLGIIVMASQLSPDVEQIGLEHLQGE
jgi:hypothetical protein